MTLRISLAEKAAELALLGSVIVTLFPALSALWIVVPVAAAFTTAFPPKTVRLLPGVTVTVIDAVRLPSTVVTVIVAVPEDTPVTTPLALTVAMFVLLDDHVTLRFGAVAGVTVASSCSVLPTVMVRFPPGIVTPVTADVIQCAVSVTTPVPAAGVNCVLALFELAKLPLFAGDTLQWLNVCPALVPAFMLNAVFTVRAADPVCPVG